MSLALKNKINRLRQRAVMLQKVRSFFASRDVWEVETPLIGSATIPDPCIESITVNIVRDAGPYYLQTSPEFCMKRLLAAGSGSIYQICKAFRQGEVGRNHNPEFTMIEWYRVGLNTSELMAEIDDLIQHLLNTQPADKISYQAVFQKILSIDPLTASIDDLQTCAKEHDLVVTGDLTRDDWLNVLFSHLIEPQIGIERPTFVFEYPTTQAALARISTEDPRVAERFELFFKGFELANGFGELGDANEQRARFEADLLYRKNHNQISVVMPEKLLQALEEGFPDCSGVAIGFDRLVMLATQATCIADVISMDFPAC